MKTLTLPLMLLAFLIGCYLASLRPLKDRGPGTPRLPHWPAVALDANKRNINWGQCEVCNLVLTDEDVKDGTAVHVAGNGFKGYRCAKH